VAVSASCETTVPAGWLVDDISGVETAVYARFGVCNYQGGLFSQAHAGQFDATKNTRKDVLNPDM
jgi:hypothetical protein